MKKRIFIWILSLVLAIGMFFLWYSTLPKMLVKTKNTFSGEQKITLISGKYLRYKNQDMLLYGIGENPKIQSTTVGFIDGTWLLRSIDPTMNLTFSGPKISGTIHGRWTIFIDFDKNIVLSIDALISSEKFEKILPSFYLQNWESKFFDLWTLDAIIPKDIWELYKDNAIKDEKEVLGGFSEEEITANIKILLEREPNKDNAGNVYFEKDLRIRRILEDLSSYIKETKKEKKSWNSPAACSKFITESIAKGKAIDPNMFEWLEEPLLMWAKKNSNPDFSLSWESIFQKYHSDVLSNNPLAISIRDKSILDMIQTSNNPTYEMWLYLAFILWKEKTWSPYLLKIMTEMVRLGEILKSGEHKKTIIEESNLALSNLKKILEETYFDTREGYIFILKKNLKDENGQDLDTKIFVNDLNSLIIEIDKSTLFLEYPDFRILRRHLVWFTCIFGKNNEYLQDIRICRSEV